MKKILFISGRVYPNSAQGIRNTSLINSLKNSFEVYHLTFDLSILTIEGARNYNIDIGSFGKFKVYFFKLLKRIKINFFPDEHKFFIPAYLKSIKMLSIEIKFDSVIIGMAPFSFLKLGSQIKNIFPDIKLIGDMSDPFSGNAEILLQKEITINKYKQWELKHMPNFDVVVILNQKIKEFYDNLIPDNNLKVEVIEQGIDLSYINAKIQKQKEGRRLQFIYAGQFYDDFRNPSVLFEEVSKFIDKIDLLLYGATKNKYHGTGYKNIQYNGFIKQEQVVKEFTKADVIVLLDNFIGIQVPGKTLECLALNKPKLFIYENENSPTLEYVNAARGVVLCRNNDKDISNAIKYLIKKYSSITSEFDSNPYLWENLVEKYIRLIND